MKLLLTLYMTVFSLVFLHGQLYVEKQTRHRFASMNVGVDMHMYINGKTQYLDIDGGLRDLSIPFLGEPRILIGGTHFWGHADFQIAIPVTQSSQKSNDQTIFFTSGVETSIKIYPWRMQHGRLTPYVGTAMNPFYFFQNNELLEYSRGPEVTWTRWPLKTGLTYTTNNHMIEAGVTYNYDSEIDYYVSRTQQAVVNTPPLAITLSWKYLFDTTISAEKDWESGRTAEVTEVLGNKGKLDGFFLGAGMSSSLWLGSSSYNTENRPYVADYGWALFPDFTAGYYFHKLDANITVNYRSYTSGSSTYGSRQSASRQSIGIEVVKNIGDYHGFVPFVGAIVSHEKLSFIERFEDDLTQDVADTKLAVGLTVGWDIRPNRLQAFILRTNLRYYPKIELDLDDGTSVNFNTIEFNFIQAIIYPGRMF